MSLRYIYGRAGSGKSSFCLFDIKKEIEKGNDSPLILLVPEQFSFQGEKKIIEVLGEAGAFKVQVLSFSRMAEKVFNEVGGLARKHMNNAGRSMLIYSVMEKNRDKLQVYKKASKKQGFTAGISELITEFKRYGITPEELMESMNSMKDLNLKSKLSDIYLIYSNFEVKLHKKYIDSEDDLTILASRIDDSGIFNGAYIWVDEFSSFTPQEYSILEKLFKKACKISITLCTDGMDNGLFIPVKNTEEKLNRIIENHGIKYEKPVWLHKESGRFSRNGELKHMEKYVFSYPYKQYGKKTESLNIFRAFNNYTEVEETAREIIRLCRDQGVMYRDIAVVSGELDAYESLIRSIFSEYGISYFIDKKSNIVNSPLIVLLISGLEIITKNWSYEAVFRYLKTGLLHIAQEEVDLLENYVLANGIKGKRWTETEIWQQSLHFEYNSDISEEEAIYIERVNNTRSQAAAPLINFSNKIKGEKNCSEITEALYEFICEINIPETIEKLIQTFEDQGQMDRSAEYRQVWDIIVELMEQMVEVMGDEELSLDEYTKILNAGFQEYEIGIIPPAIDQVLVGSIQRLKSHEISVLFILGANDGIFPAPSINDGVLTDEDRIALIDNGLEVSRDSKSLAFEEQFLTYTTLTRANQYLRLSFPAADFEGKTRRPSIIISRLKKIFPMLTEYSDIIKDQSEPSRLRDITSKQPLLNELLAELKHEKESDVLNCALNWYYSHEPWKTKLIKGAKGYYYSNSVKIKDINKIRDLYGKKLNISVSRLEKYVECPFSYFIQYGLKAGERKIYKLAPPDIGTLMHEALYRFSKSLKEEGRTWFDMEGAWAEEKIFQVVEDIVSNSPGSILKSSKRYSFIEENVKKTLKRSVELIALHIKRSEFVPVGYEMSFGYEGDYPPISVELESGEMVNLSGKVDRIDMLERNGETYIRIIDYKSGNKEFKLNDVYYGVQMQLLIYLDAILSELSKNVQENVLPAGVLYFRLDDPMVKTTGEIGEDEILSGIMKALKMNGLILNNISVISGMDSELSGTSDIIPVSINKDNSISSRSSCVDSSEFDILRAYVKTLVKRICSEILNGNADIKPYKKKGITSCRYCSFSSICQFDEGIKGNRYRILKEKKEEELWKLMESDAEQS